MYSELQKLPSLDSEEQFYEQSEVVKNQLARALEPFRTPDNPEWVRNRATEIVESADEADGLSSPDVSREVAQFAKELTDIQRSTADLFDPPGTSSPKSAGQRTAAPNAPSESGERKPQSAVVREEPANEDYVRVAQRLMNSGLSALDGLTGEWQLMVAMPDEQYGQIRYPLVFENGQWGRRVIPEGAGQDDQGLWPEVFEPFSPELQQVAGRYFAEAVRVTNAARAMFQPWYDRLNDKGKPAPRSDDFGEALSRGGAKVESILEGLESYGFTKEEADNIRDGVRNKDREFLKAAEDEYSLSAALLAPYLEGFLNPPALQERPAQAQTRRPQVEASASAPASAPAPVSASAPAPASAATDVREQLRTHREQRPDLYRKDDELRGNIGKAELNQFLAAMDDSVFKDIEQRFGTKELTYPQAIQATKARIQELEQAPAPQQKPAEQESRQEAEDVPPWEDPNGQPPWETDDTEQSASEQEARQETEDVPPWDTDDTEQSASQADSTTESQVPSDDGPPAMTDDELESLMSASQQNDETAPPPDLGALESGTEVADDLRSLAHLAGKTLVSGDDTLVLPEKIGEPVMLNGGPVPSGATRLIISRVLADESVDPGTLIQLAKLAGVYTRKSKPVEELSINDKGQVVRERISVAAAEYPLIDDLGGQLFNLKLPRRDDTSSGARRVDPLKQTAADYKRLLNGLVAILQEKNKQAAHRKDPLVMAARKKGHVLVLPKSQRDALYARLGISVESLKENINDLGRVGATVFRAGGYQIPVSLDTLKNQQFKAKDNDGTLAISQSVEEGLAQGTLVVRGKVSRWFINKGTVRSPIRLVQPDGTATDFEAEQVADEFLFKASLEQGLNAVGKSGEAAFHVLQLDTKSGASFPLQSVLNGLVDPAGYIRRQTAKLDELGIESLFSKTMKDFLDAGLPAEWVLSDSSLTNWVKSFNPPAVRDYAIASDLIPKGHVAMAPNTLADYEAKRKEIAEEESREYKPLQYGETVYLHREPALPTGTGTVAMRFAGTIEFQVGPQRRGIAVNPKEPKAAGMGLDFDGDRLYAIAPHEGFVTRDETGQTVSGDLNALVKPVKKSLPARAKGDPINAAIIETANGMEDMVGVVINAATKVLETSEPGKAGSGFITGVTQVAQAFIASVKKAVDAARTKRYYDRIQEIVRGVKNEGAERTNLGDYDFLVSKLRMAAEAAQGLTDLAQRKAALEQANRALVNYAERLAATDGTTAVEQALAQRIVTVQRLRTRIFNAQESRERPDGLARAGTRQLELEAGMADPSNSDPSGVKIVQTASNAYSQKYRQIGATRDEGAQKKLKREAADIVAGLAWQVRLGNVTPAAILMHGPPTAVTRILSPEQVRSIYPEGRSFAEVKARLTEGSPVLEPGFYTVGYDLDGENFTLNNEAGESIGLNPTSRFTSVAEQLLNAGGEVEVMDVADPTMAQSGRDRRPYYTITMRRSGELGEQTVNREVEVKYDDVAGVTYYGRNVKRRAFVETLRSMMQQLGLGELPIRLVESGSVPEAINEWANELGRYAEDSQDYQAAKNTLLALQKAHTMTGPARVIYNNGYSSQERNIPFIVFNPNYRPAATMRFLAHELGHLVQVHYLRHAPNEIRQALIRQAKQMMDERGQAKGQRLFAEWFADQAVSYLDRLQRDMSDPNAASANDGLRKFFHGLTKIMRALWRQLRTRANLAESYREFIEKVVRPNGSQGADGLAPARDNQPLWANADGAPAFSFMEERRLNGLYSAMKGAWENRHDSQRYQGLLDARNWLFRNTLQTLASWFDSHGSHMRELGGYFVRRTDARADNRGAGAVWETRSRQDVAYVWKEFFADALDQEALRRDPNLWTRMQGMDPGLDQDSPLYQSVMNALIDEVDLDQVDAEARPHVQRIRQALEDTREFLTREYDLEIRKTKNYWPVIVDLPRFERDRGEIERLLSRMLIEEQGLDPVEAMHKAAEIFEDTVNAGGSIIEMVDGQITGDSARAVAPGFEWARQRRWAPRVKQILSNWQVKDIEGTLYRYVRAGVKRGVTQKMFGRYIEVDGQMRMDPLFKINLLLRKALDAGEIDQREFNFATDVAIPALFGQLGVDVDPRWKTFSSWAVTYQNVRLLGFVLFSSLTDPSLILSRGGLRSTWNGLKSIIQGNYNDKIETLEWLGASRSEQTEHIINAEFASDYYGAGPQKVNEAFFRFVQMKRWTDMTRVWALETAKDYIVRHAAKAESSVVSNQRLAALGLSREDVQRWQAAGQPIGDRRHSEVNAALNQFIDDAVLRPTAALRPGWGSDMRLALFFHLKSFAFAFYERAGRQVLTEAMRIWGQERGPAKALAVLPALQLMVPALLLAMAGYELRKEIGWGLDVPDYMQKDGLDYMLELIERAGILGPAQFIADAGASADRGQIIALSVLGPTVDQMQDFTRGVDSGFWRAVPLVQQLPAARQWLNEEIW